LLSDSLYVAQWGSSGSSTIHPRLVDSDTKTVAAAKDAIRNRKGPEIESKGEPEILEGFIARFKAHLPFPRIPDPYIYRALISPSVSQLVGQPLHQLPSRAPKAAVSRCLAFKH
jgi:hypothetical protein